MPRILGLGKLAPERYHVRPRQHFPSLPFRRGGTGEAAFFVSLVTTPLSSALLIATPSFHRLRVRVEDKGRIAVLGNRLAIAGDRRRLAVRWYGFELRAWLTER